jgi:DNA-binding winged helix-turn-helix (wHTH) protein
MARPAQRIVYRFGGFTLDADRQVLLAANGAEVSLRPKTFSLLLLLVENAGRTISKEMIMASVWPGIFVTENNVTQCVHEIRHALGSKAHRILRTRPRRGYMIAADVDAARSAGVCQNRDSGSNCAPAASSSALEGDTKPDEIGTQFWLQGGPVDLAEPTTPHRGPVMVMTERPQAETLVQQYCLEKLLTELSAELRERLEGILSDLVKTTGACVAEESPGSIERGAGQPGAARSRLARPGDTAQGQTSQHHIDSSDPEI